MTSRTVLLTIHIVAVAGWLGADLLRYAVAPRLERASPPVTLAWARQVHWLHDRYYAVVAVVILASGVLLVLDGDWSWSGWFIWVGIGAILTGGTLGGGVLRSLAARRITALEAGDEQAAAATGRRMVPFEILVTVAAVLAVLAMVDRWHA